MAGLGLFSVIAWYWTELHGAGDLRLYFWIQFAPIFAIPFLLLFFPARYTYGKAYWGVMLCYASAKALEHFDAAVFQALGFISGHSLKHLFAAGSAWIIFHMLAHRQPITSTKETKG
jgi:hypothetical protein